MVRLGDYLTKQGQVYAIRFYGQLLLTASGANVGGIRIGSWWQIHSPP
jgi:hypothetical protein